jgi:hypothetical protein
MRQTVLSLLVAIALFGLAHPAIGQMESDMPTTPEAWGRMIDNTDLNNPKDLMQMMTAMTVRGYNAVLPKLPASIKQKIKAGGELTNAEVNTIADAIGKEVTRMMAAQMGGEVGEVEPANIKPGSEDEKSLKAFVKAMNARAGGGATTGAKPATPPNAVQDWKDFIHYSRIARLDLAAAHGRQFLAAKLDPAAMLEIVEGSVYGKNYEKDLQRMINMKGPGVADSGIVDVAKAVDEAIDAAKVAVIRNPSRIREEIAKLDDSLRARTNATRRLKEAGEYAAPQMIEMLTGEAKDAKQLRPYVIEAAVEVGRPVVVPFAEVIHMLPAVAQQDVARILARIGYPASLPYLKRLMESGKLDEATQQVVAKAFAQIASSREIAADSRAADLFLGLAEDYYAGQSSLILDPDASHNLRWVVDDRANLTYQRIPTAVFGDVMAMQAARRSLQLDADLAEALSLWVAANFRRENHLPEGEPDPSYGREMRSPAFYAMTAGPNHIKPVLARAVSDADARLALDAVRALAATAGTDSLTTEAGAVLRALNYPDARVRYETAFAVAKANPSESFEGAGRVIPVLAEAVRQTGEPVALVIAEDQSKRNQLTALVDKAGYDVLAGATLEEVEGALTRIPTADLIVLHDDAAYVNAFSVARRGSYKVSATPVVILSMPGELVGLTRMFADDASVVVIDGGANEAQVTEAMKQATASMSGGELTADENEAYAVQALALLSDLAIKRSPVFDVSLATDSLIEALGDDREAVMLGAGGVLSLIGSETAQQAVADAALSDRTRTRLRVELLADLADSAKRFGNLLTERQVAQMNAIIVESDGDLADAAAEAYGALDLPTAQSVNQITK